MPVYVFMALFTASKVGVAPASAPTVDVCNGAGTLVVTGGATTAMSGITGLYKYAYNNATPDEYVAIFKTVTTTVDLQHIPSWTPTVIYTNLDAAISTRSTLTSAQAADAVWDETAADHVAVGSTGKLLSTAGAATDPLLNAVPGTYASGTAGNALGRIGSGQVTVVSPVATDSAITLVYGDDYLNADGRALSFVGTNWPTLTGGSIALIVRTSTVTTIAGVVTGAAACYVELTSAQVIAITAGLYDYDLQFTDTGGHIATLVQSTLAVVKDVR